ncbi:MAG: glycosyltransferase family 4 protein [Nitrospinae bacterium]|nr:glycosyltransferase family 4 protein [Nitrospinota bacterium]
MKVVHLIAHMRLGAGRYLADIARAQQRELGRHVTVAVSDDIDPNWRTDPKLAAELAAEGIETLRLGDFFSRGVPALAAAARNLAPVLSGAVAHCHSAMPAAAAHMAGARAIVITCHGWSQTRPEEYDLQDALAYRLARGVVTSSRFWAARLRRDFNVPAVNLIEEGIDLTPFAPLDISARPHAPLRIVTVCELTHRKGVDLLIAAMPRVWERFPETSLNIIGDGDAAADLRARAKPYGARITFHGYEKFPYARLGEFDLFCLPTRSDNFPAAIVEAMLASLPVVGTAVGAIPDIIGASGCGAVAAPENPASLADALMEVIAQGPSRMAALGAAGARHAHAHYDIRRMVRELDAVYRKALDTA